MTDSLILPVDTEVFGLSEEVLLHIKEKHGEKSRESFAAYEALSRLSLAFNLSESNRRLPYIEYNANGKPFFREYPSVSFSLSHAKGMTAAIMSNHEDVGIDIEKIELNKLNSYRAIANSRFFEGELKKMKDCQKSELEEIKCFLSIWTQKEACAKILQIPPISIDTSAFSSDIHAMTEVYKEDYVISKVKKIRT